MQPFLHMDKPEPEKHTQLWVTLQASKNQQKEESQKVKEVVYAFPSWATTANLGYQDGNRRVLLERKGTVLEENGNEKKEAIKK